MEPIDLFLKLKEHTRRQRFVFQWRKKRQSKPGLLEDWEKMRHGDIISQKICWYTTSKNMENICNNCKVLLSKIQYSTIAWFIILPLSKFPTSPALGITQNGGCLFHVPVIPHSKVSNDVPDFPSNGKQVTLHVGNAVVVAGKHSKIPGWIRVIPQSTYADKK